MRLNVLWPFALLRCTHVFARVQHGLFLYVHPPFLCFFSVFGFYLLSPLLVKTSFFFVLLLLLLTFFFYTGRMNREVYKRKWLIPKPSQSLLDLLSLRIIIPHLCFLPHRSYKNKIKRISASKSFARFSSNMQFSVSINFALDYVAIMQQNVANRPSFNFVTVALLISLIICLDFMARNITAGCRQIGAVMLAMILLGHGCLGQRQQEQLDVIEPEQQTQERRPHVAILKQINQINKDGSYALIKFSNC